MIAVCLHQFAEARLNHDSAVGPIGLLKSRVVEEPVGTNLGDRETIGKSLAGGDTAEADARNAVHPEEQGQSMPVN